MNMPSHLGRVAVIGAGLSGSHCAQSLAASGFAVHLFDKSRGVGGRLATRRLAWTDAHGQAQLTPIDHGAPAFTAVSEAFAQWVAQAAQPGWIQAWAPSTGTLAPHAPRPSWVPSPDMPSLCHRLNQGRGILHLNHTVDALSGHHGAWQLSVQGQAWPETFDAVVLAMPAQQAAALLSPHRADWATQAQAVRMAPCWTLMGVEADAGQPLAWEAGAPASGALAWVARNDLKPGRQAIAGQRHWVAQATADWTRAHLHDDATSVQAALQADLQALLGHAMVWQQAVVHRWLYATVEAGWVNDAPCWWDAQTGLGVCGDFFAPTAQRPQDAQGAECAWLSAQALSQRIAQAPHTRPATAP